MTRGRPFLPGQSGNPSGKPRGVRNRATAVLQKMAEDDAPDVVRAVIERAKAGDITAAGLLIARLWPQPRGRPVVLDLPELTKAADLPVALGAVARAVGTGELTPEEGQAMARVLELQRKGLELCDLEARVAKLEER